MDLQAGKLIMRPKVLDIPITDVVIHAIEKWRRIMYLSHENFITEKRKELFFLMLILQEWTTTTNNKQERLKKTRMNNINTKITIQKVFMIRILNMMRILIRKDWMGYQYILKETQIYTRRKIKKIMKTKKKKMTLSV